MKKKILLIGPGYMGREYCKVLLAQGYEPIVIGRSRKSAYKFEKDMGIAVSTDTIDNVINRLAYVPQYAIVASSEESHAVNTMELLDAGVKNILLEKPGGVSIAEVQQIDMRAKRHNAKVYIAYNRRFYASTEKALEIIEKDGGVRDATFEITEWGNVIGKAVETRGSNIKEEILSNNSSHVIDLFIFFCGKPIQYNFYVKNDPELTWRKSGCIYAGAGITERDILFSYHADWNAPGRWGLEIMTKNHRLIFRPMEKLKIQEKESVEIKDVEIKDEMDQLYKPGIYRQVESFVKNIDDGKKILISQQVENMKIYAAMEHKI